MQEQIDALLASGQLYSGRGGENPGVSGSIADALNNGYGFYGGSGLSIPGLDYHVIGGEGQRLPDLFRSDLSETDNPSGARVPISYKDWATRGFTGAQFSGGTDSEGNETIRGANSLQDFWDANGITSQAARNSLLQQFRAGVEQPKLGIYIAPAQWDAISNAMSGYNSASRNEFYQNALMAAGTVLGAGTLYNMYGAGAEGATTTGIGEAVTPAYGTDLSAIDAFNAGDIFYGSGPTAESGGFLTGMGEGGGLFGNTTLDVMQFPSSATVLNTGGSAASGGGMFETLKQWFPTIVAGSSLVSGLLGYNAAGEAADATREGAAGATAEARRQFDTVRSDTAPYRAAGVMSLDALGKLLGLVPGYSPESELIKTPGYQFRLGQGNEALTNIQSKGGYRLGGRAVKEALRYNQDYATGEFGGAVDRLFRLGGFGTSGVNTSASAGANAANTAANASIIAGNAGATGAYGQASAVNNAIQGGLQNYLTWDMYNRFAA